MKTWYITCSQKHNSDCSDLRKETRNAPPVAASRSAPPVAASRSAPPVAASRRQFRGGSGRTQRQFGQDDSLGQGNADNTDTAEYNFAYAVDSDEGAKYSHQEEAAEGVISGEYRVNLPDGRTQIVR